METIDRLNARIAALNAECERIREDRDFARHVAEEKTLQAGIDTLSAIVRDSRKERDLLGREGLVLMRERDEARAERDEARAERDEARRQLAQAIENVR